MASWPGTPLDEMGIVRILNAQGTKPPTIWIFNGANEAEQLSEALGEDRPLIFTRSAHLLVRNVEAQRPARSWLAQNLTEHLAGLLDVSVEGLRFGANCQGCEPMLSTVNSLISMGYTTDELLLINYNFPPVRSDVAAILVYGGLDKLSDPFVKDYNRAKESAAQIFPEYRREVVNCGHGQYFQPGAVDDLVRFLTLSKA